MYCMNCGAELPKDVSFDTESSCFSNNWKAGAFYSIRCEKLLSEKHVTVTGFS